MCAHASKIIVVAASARYGKRALYRVCPLEDVDTIVSDKAPGEAFRAALDTAKVKLIWREGRQKREGSMSSLTKKAVHGGMADLISWFAMFLIYVMMLVLLYDCRTKFLLIETMRI